MFKITLRELKTHIGYEKIHNQQVSKMKVKQNPILDSPTAYFKNPQEIMAMAMAYTTSQELTTINNKDTVLKNLKLNKIHHPILHKYKKIGGKTYKIFINYLVNYLED